MVDSVDSVPPCLEDLTLSEKPEEHDGDSSASSSCDSEGSVLIFLPTMNTVRFDDLAAKAVKTRYEREAWKRSTHSNPPDPISCQVQTPPMRGTNDLVYTLIFSDGVKWVARIPGNGISGFGPLHRQRMVTSIRTAALIRSVTSIPIPEVFAWETTTETIGVPYSLEMFVEGSLLSERWIDKSWATKDKRLKVLRNLAAVMSELSKLQFPKSGALCFSEDGNFSHVGELVEVIRDIRDQEKPWGTISTLGPFDTLESYLTHNWGDRAGGKPERRKAELGREAELAVLRLAVESIPESHVRAINIKIYVSNGRFTLGHPNLNYFNIFVDDEGNITGIIGWDGVCTGARSLGFAIYPSWITQDWDPIMYGYGVPGCTTEDSQEELLRYQQEYAQAFAKLQLPEASYSKKDTELSQLMEAICIAVGSNMCRYHIVEKLLTYAFKSQAPFNIFELFDAYEEGNADEWMAAIKKAFAGMWHVEWAEEEPVAEEESGSEEQLDI